MVKLVRIAILTNYFAELPPLIKRVFFSKRYAIQPSSFCWTLKLPLNLNFTDALPLIQQDLFLLKCSLLSGGIRPLLRVLKEIWDGIAASPLIQSQPVQLTFRVFKEMKDDDATHLAAGVAYYAIFSLFPLLLGFLAISGIVLNPPELQEELLNFVADNLPGSESFMVGNVG